MPNKTLYQRLVAWNIYKHPQYTRNFFVLVKVYFYNIALYMVFFKG